MAKVDFTKLTFMPWTQRFDTKHFSEYICRQVKRKFKSEIGISLVFKCLKVSLIHELKMSLKRPPNEWNRDLSFTLESSKIHLLIKALYIVSGSKKSLWLWFLVPCSERHLISSCTLYIKLAVFVWYQKFLVHLSVLFIIKVISIFLP